MTEVVKRKPNNLLSQEPPQVLHGCRQLVP